MPTKKTDLELVKERRRLGAFLASLTFEEIEGIKKVLLSSLIEQEKRKEVFKREQGQ